MAPLPAKWQITPDREYTLDHVGSVAMRTAYDDLIAPLERAVVKSVVHGFGRHLRGVLFDVRGR